ncbi:hypothetical protein BaRGS_00004419 [Batillaria attramentaria]|uniref:Uncharacterized protein n=1 Tax=Batillaria attramentaria TaxID=370345 RepID=A0ABD0LX51_9CAEN
MLSNTPQQKKTNDGNVGTWGCFEQSHALYPTKDMLQMEQEEESTIADTAGIQTPILTPALSQMSFDIEDRQTRLTFSIHTRKLGCTYRSR